MRVAIITSRQDPAGRNMLGSMKATSWPATISFHEIAGPAIYAEDLDKEIDADVFLFATTHRSRENTPAFTCHCIGNWDKATVGGRERTLVPAPALLLRTMFLELKKRVLPGYLATLEATHHGPFLEKPALFVELGSTEKEWADEKAGAAIAEAIHSAVSHAPLPAEKIAFGIGGPHYCNSFMKALEKGIAVGHMIPKHMLPFLDAEMLKQAAEKIPGCTSLLLDWKGMGKEKERIKALASESGLEVLRTDKL